MMYPDTPTGVARHGASCAEQPVVLGLDVGGVLVGHADAETDESLFGRRPLEVPPVPGALDAVVSLATMFNGRIHIVSKAGSRIHTVTRQWLGGNGFLGANAIPSGNVHFVRKRREKASVCAEFGLTHFVDDRIDVLETLASVGYRFLFTGANEHDVPIQTDNGSAWVIASDWVDLVDKVYLTFKYGHL